MTIYLSLKILVRDYSGSHDCLYNQENVPTLPDPFLVGGGVCGIRLSWLYLSNIVCGYYLHLQMLGLCI